jgi:hypothetical protein
MSIVIADHDCLDTGISQSSTCTAPKRAKAHRINKIASLIPEIRRGQIKGIQTGGKPL